MSDKIKPKSVWSKETQAQIDKTLKMGEELQALVDKQFKSGKIKLEVIDNDTHHIALTFGRPGRTEMSVVRGMPLLEVYEGEEVDMDQDPLFCYDGTLEENKDCEG